MTERELSKALQYQFMRLDPYKFETFCSTALHHMGYQNTIVNRHWHDYGVDVYVSKRMPDGRLKRYAIQIKKYGPGYKVSLNDVKKFVNSKGYTNAPERMIITTGGIYDDALKYANANHIKVYYGDYFAKQCIESNVAVRYDENGNKEIDKEYLSKYARKKKKR